MGEIKNPDRPHERPTPAAKSAFPGTTKQHTGKAADDHIHARCSPSLNSPKKHTRPAFRQEGNSFLDTPVARFHFLRVAQRSADRSPEKANRSPISACAHRHPSTPRGVMWGPLTPAGMPALRPTHLHSSTYAIPQVLFKPVIIRRRHCKGEIILGSLSHPQRRVRIYP